MKKALQLSLFFGFILLTSCKSVTAPKTTETKIDQAYQSQKLLVQRTNQSIIGYKAGLTSQAGQSKFNVSEPLAGVLFKNGLSHNRQVYLLEDYDQLMLETEIGFILNSDLTHTISKPEHLYKLIDKVVPVIELPNLAFPEMSKVTGLTLIETNVASNQVLIGSGKSLGQIRLTEIQTQLNKNGVAVIQGHANDAMGDQMTALQWLVNRLIKSGYHIKRGDILITGALGKMIPAKPGQYDADFGQLGQLSFSIR